MFYFFLFFLKGFHILNYLFSALVFTCYRLKYKTNNIFAILLFQSILRDYKLLFAILTVAIVWGTTFWGYVLQWKAFPMVCRGHTPASGCNYNGTILIFRKELKWIGWKNLRYQIIFLP